MSESQTSAAGTFMDAAEQLFRQLHPSWKQGDKITSQLFKPTRKDEGKLSTDRGSKISAASSMSLHISGGSPSIGVFAVTVQEVNEEAKLAAVDDPIVPEKPAHAYVDMTALNRSASDAAAGLLRDLAVLRGCLHPE
jgi:hypothetical protein